MFSKVVYHFVLSSVVYESSSCFISLSTFTVVSVFYIGHFIGYEITIILIYISLMINGVVHFSYAYFNLSWNIFCVFSNFKIELSFYYGYCVYSGYKSFGGYICCDFFFIGSDLSVHFLTGIFWWAEIFVLIKTTLSSFLFMILVPKLTKNTFSSRSFMVWGFMFMIDHK